MTALAIPGADRTADGAVADGRRGPLRVTISTPRGGIVDADYTLSLRARVSDARVRTALLSVNGAVYHVPVRGGRIRQTIMAVPGNNRVGVVVRRQRRVSAARPIEGERFEVARDSITFYLRGKPTELIVLLTWPSRGEIIDLWVREPGGETCKWDHRVSAAGGRLLDFSEDAIGFGSQAFVLPEVRDGSYRVKVHYWGAYGRDDDRNIGAYEELIERLDAVDEARDKKTVLAGERNELGQRRAELLRRLDAWAAPAAPQTPVRAEAILFAGTRHERRWRFAIVPQRTGQLLTLGDVEVSGAMIRAARAAVGGAR